MGTTGDQSAGDLALAFYEALLRGRTAAEALFDARHAVAGAEDTTPLQLTMAGYADLRLVAAKATTKTKAKTKAQTKAKTTAMTKAKTTAKTKAASDARSHATPPHRSSAPTTRPKVKSGKTKPARPARGSTGSSGRPTQRRGAARPKRAR
jgi:hypothetical protein